MEQRDSFGYWLRRRRKALDLTQTELAQRVGCASVTLRKIEADERHPSPQMAERLAQCLALPPAEWPRFVAAALGQQTTAWLEVPATAVRLPGNLPAPITTLIGRDDDVAAVSALLQREEVRLLTLTGPVGVGKTQLAIAVGRKLALDCRDGVYLVALAVVPDPTLVPSAIATTLGLRESRSTSPAQLVAEYLAARQLLLILDNFEHLLPAAPLLASLLCACPRLQVLVTSRACLHLYGEHEYAVAPLPVPQPDELATAATAPAVRLFCVRAQAVRADFRLTPATTPAIVAVCRQFDGLPLAIELAAARIRLFSPQELQQRLAAGPPLRLRALERAIAWSYELLSPAQQRLLARLAVFAGGFSLPAAEAVAADPATAGECGGDLPSSRAPAACADALDALLDQSLLVREPNGAAAPTSDAAVADLPRRTGTGGRQHRENGTPPRNECLHCPLQLLHETTAAESHFTLLETIRDFALDRLGDLGEVEATRRRHAFYFTGWAVEAAHAIQGPDQVFWLACLERNMGNLRAALAWLLQTGEVVQAATMACALGLFWQRHGHYREGRQWLQQVLAAMREVPVPDNLRAHTLQAAATLAYRQGDWLVAQQWLAESLALFNSQEDREGAARVLFDQGWIAIDQAAWDEALRLNEASLALAQQAGDMLAAYRALTNLGWTHLCMGEMEAAAPFFDAAHEHARTAGHTRGIAVSLANLAWITHYRGDELRTETLAQASLRLCCQLGERELEAECLELLAIAAICRRDARRAAVLSGAAEALRAALHILHPPTQHAAVAHAAAIEAMRQVLPAGEFAAAWSQGRGLRLEAMVVFALGCERKRQGNASTQTGF